MKTVFRTIITFSALLGLVACEPEYFSESGFPMADYVGTEPEMVFEGASDISVSKLGGDYEAKVKSNLPWLVESNADWISITSESRGVATAEYVPITFSVSKNTDIQPRTGKIRVWIDYDHEAVITVNQAPLEISDLGNSYYVKMNGTGDGSSWENASGDLSGILAAAVNADKVYIAAGTYYPSTRIPGGKDTDGDKTFFVGANITVVGGFPADAKTGAVSEPGKNETILSGNKTANHVMVIAAPKHDLFKLSVTGLTLTEGAPAASGTGNISLNGALLYRFYAGGLAICGSEATINDCIIKDNVAPGYCAGVFNTVGSKTVMNNCKIINNTVTAGNCGGVWNSAATLTLNNCEVSGNKAGGGVGAGIYIHDAAGSGREGLTYIYNCTITGNVGGGAVTSRGAGVYVRECGKCVIVNSTIHANEGGNGAGVAVYATSARATECYIISSTITENKGNPNSLAGAVEQVNPAKLHVYNSIVSGNTANGKLSDICATASNKIVTIEPETLSNTINGTIVYGAAKAVVTGKSFDHATMLAALSDGVRKLSGSDNPAKTYGMTVEEMSKIVTGYAGGEVPAEILGFDAKGNKRTSTIMGAYVGN